MGRYCLHFSRLYRYGRGATRSPDLTCATTMGGTDQTVGFVIGIFSVIALVSRFASGLAADRRGRKTAFLAGLGSCACAGFVYLLQLGIKGALSRPYPAGLRRSLLSHGAAAWVIEIAGVHRSAQALGYLSSGIWGGISLGPAVGNLRQARSSVLPRFFRLSPRYSECPSSTSCKRTIARTLQSASRPLDSARMMLPGLTIGFVNVHYPVLTGFLVLHLTSQGFAGKGSFMAYALIILFSRFFFGGLPDRIPRLPHLLRRPGGDGHRLDRHHLGAQSSDLSRGRDGRPWFGASRFPGRQSLPPSCAAFRRRRRGTVVSVLSAFSTIIRGHLAPFAAGMMAKRWGYPSAFVMAAGVGRRCGDLRPLCLLVADAWSRRSRKSSRKRSDR